jgi:hypothetical protein
LAWAQPHVETGGLVVIEAEHYANTFPDVTGTRDWYVQDGGSSGPGPDPDGFHSGASGNAYMECLRDTRVTHADPMEPGSFYNDSTQGARLDYPVVFQTPGQYRVWVRVQSTGTEDNGIHVAVNGSIPPNGWRIQWCGGGWRWSNAQRYSGGTACGINGTVYVDIPTAGEHLISFYQREDGAELDRFLMTTDTGYTPSGIGPAESPREGPIIDIEPEQIARTMFVGDNLPDDTFTISNNGTDTLDYTITDDADWLVVSPASGSATSEVDTINVAYDLADRHAGQLTGTITVTSTNGVNSPQTLTVSVTIETVPPDFDGDGDVDIADFGHFQTCYSGAGLAQTDVNCQDALLDGDEDVDQGDFGLFQGCMSGANVAVVQTCMD